MIATCSFSGAQIHIAEFAALQAVSIHPIFNLPARTLDMLYTKHTLGKLNAKESYLLFLALLHRTGAIEFQCPAVQPSEQLIENNIAQLLAICLKQEKLAIPQPRFCINPDTCTLESIPNWIAAWEDNIADHTNNYAGMLELESLKQVENKLSSLILSGEPANKYAAVIADWAAKAANFPAAKQEEWKRIIRICFNKEKIFATSLAEIKALSEYCSIHIEAGSIHFHALAQVLREGVTNHIDYLGLAVPISDYILLPSLGDSPQKDDCKLLQAIAASAPSTEPKKEDYPTLAAYIKAKLAFRTLEKL